MGGRVDRSTSGCLAKRHRPNKTAWRPSGWIGTAAGWGCRIGQVVGTEGGTIRSAWKRNTSVRSSLSSSAEVSVLKRSKACFPSSRLGFDCKELEHSAKRQTRVGFSGYCVVSPSHVRVLKPDFSIEKNRGY